MTLRLQPNREISLAAPRWRHRLMLPALLGGAWFVASLIPAPGQWLRTAGWQVAGLWETQLTPVNCMLALLLLAVGQRLRGVSAASRPTLACTAVAVALRVLLATLVTFAAASGLIAAPLAFGLVIVALMPTAGSAGGWALASRADIHMAGGTILSTTLLSLVIAPAFWSTASAFAGPDSWWGEASERLTISYAGHLAIPWVLVPLLTGWTLGNHPWWIARERFVRGASLVVLVLLNYANASMALPHLWTGASWSLPVRVMTGVFTAAALLSASSARLAGWIFPAAVERRRACTITATMSNTGLGLVAVTAALPDALEVHLVLVTWTLAQHLFASLVAANLSLADQETPQPADRCAASKKPLPATPSLAAPEHSQRIARDAAAAPFAKSHSWPLPVSPSSRRKLPHR